MGFVSTQNTHPLTACVAKDTQRDVVGHLVLDQRGDREFRFVKIKGESTASQGMCLVAFQLSAVADENFEVTPFASANLTAAGRDAIGIMVGQSTAASGDFCYAMTRGKLGKVNGSLYPDAIFANVSTTVVAGERLECRAGSGTSEYKCIAASIGSTGTQFLSIYARVCCVALSSDSGGRLIRGMFKSPLLFGGGYGPIL